jgi:HSP20 family protein
VQVKAWAPPTRTRKSKLRTRPDQKPSSGDRCGKPRTGELRQIETMKGVQKMALRDLVPWKDSSRNVSVQGNETGNPFLALHREMNRMFDEAFRSFDIGSFGSPAIMGWPSVELNETEKEVKVVAELPGLDQNDVAIELSDDVLIISGEKKSETEDKARRFSERYYGRFERRIPVDDVDQDKVAASFKDGILTVTLPKVPTAQRKVKKIAINGK